MNWNQEELEQWALAARQKEEDNLALLKYTKTDESKMKELGFCIGFNIGVCKKSSAECPYKHNIFKISGKSGGGKGKDGGGTYVGDGTGAGGGDGGKGE